MTCQTIRWLETAPQQCLPPIDGSLSGWEVQRRRSSHLNLTRRQSGETYFLKWFRHGWLRRGISPAQREWDNWTRVRKLGIPTVDALGWGLHRQGSFFVMRASLGQPLNTLSHRPSLPALERMTVQCALMVATLHNAGLCHRDLYVDHLLIHGESLCLIDLGRVRGFRRQRWVIKDLGGLLFSVWRDRVPFYLARLFLRVYLRESRFRWNRRGLLEDVQRKAYRYYRHNAGVDSPTRKGSQEPLPFKPVDVGLNRLGKFWIRASRGSTRQ